MAGHMKRSHKRKSRRSRRTRKRRGGDTKAHAAEFRTCMADGKGLRQCMSALKKAERKAKNLAYADMQKKADKAAVKAVAPAIKTAEEKVGKAMKSIEDRKKALRAASGQAKSFMGGKRRRKSKRRRSRKKSRKSRRKSRKTKRRRKSKRRRSRRRRR